MDWESFFEGDIIPLVSKARSATALDACFEVVVDALFRRANDGANKEHFRRLYANWVADMPDLDARKEHASRFLRMVKDVRKELAASAKRQPSAEPDDRCSTDIETLTKVTAVEDQDDDIDEVIDEVIDEAPSETKPAAAADFAAVFDEALIARLRQILGMLALDVRDIPFILSRPFADVLEEVLRGQVLPAMRASRHIIANLRDNHEWGAKDSARIVLEALEAGEANNAILHVWDQRWRELGPQRKLVTPARTSILGKTRPAEHKTIYSTEGREVWKRLKAHAAEHGYQPPGPSDLNVLSTLIRCQPAVLRRSLNEMRQQYEQEYEPKPFQEQAREGVLRDALNRCEGREGLPPHMAEWLAIRASLDYAKIDLDWLRRFSTCKGVKADQRRRAIPYVMTYLDANGGA
ncbi:MAG: hypothetical protein HQL39_09555 [Alphaproteobacteria bacterium]|nr:hypothetical protein [Alphaproteobacteria bacterium]